MSRFLERDFSKGDIPLGRGVKSLDDDDDAAACSRDEDEVGMRQDLAKDVNPATLCKVARHNAATMEQLNLMVMKYNAIG